MSIAPICARVTLVVVVSILFATFPALAEDSVKIRFNSGYPPPDRSSELMQLNVSRFGAPSPGREISVDHYFKSVRTILAKGQVPPKWGTVMVDGPVVQLDIVLDGAEFAIANTYGSGGIILPLGATENDKRVALAIQKLLNLTLKRMSAGLSPKQ